MKTNLKITIVTLAVLLLTVVLLSGTSKTTALNNTQDHTIAYPTTYHTLNVDGLDIFYREAGRKDAPTIVLLHGYPTSSHMFRNLIKDLADDYHLIAPDYPGFGRSDQPAMADFEYTFDNLANIVDGLLEKLQLTSYSLYVMDYGAPVGYRIFTKHPERVNGLIVQNGNAYEKGLTAFWDGVKVFWANNTPENRKPLEAVNTLEGIQWQYLHGVQDSSKISPDNWMHDIQHISRPENKDIQLALFYDYQNNVTLYPTWQKLLRKHQPPTLIVWGKNDIIFPSEGAYPYQKDLKNVEFHLLDTGHFALEEKGDEIANYIDGFMKKNKIK